VANKRKMEIAMQRSGQKVRQKVSLFVWSAGEHYWGGFQGFAGVYKSRGWAMSRLNSERNRQNNKAQLVDYKTLKVLAIYEKKDGKWLKVNNGR